MEHIKVVVSVLGGVAEVWGPESVDVEVYDWDNINEGCEHFPDGERGCPECTRQFQADIAGLKSK